MFFRRFEPEHICARKNLLKMLTCCWVKGFSGCGFRIDPNYGRKLTESVSMWGDLDFAWPLHGDVLFKLQEKTSPTKSFSIKICGGSFSLLMVDLKMAFLKMMIYAKNLSLFGSKVFFLAIV